MESRDLVIGAFLEAMRVVARGLLLAGVGLLILGASVQPAQAQSFALPVPVRVAAVNQNFMAEPGITYSYCGTNGSPCYAFMQWSGAASIQSCTTNTFITHGYMGGSPATTGTACFASALPGSFVEASDVAGLANARPVELAILAAALLLVGMNGYSVGKGF